jgi:hypothetical protein
VLDNTFKKKTSYPNWSWLGSSSTMLVKSKKGSLPLRIYLPKTLFLLSEYRPGTIFQSKFCSPKAARNQSWSSLTVIRSSFTISLSCPKLHEPVTWNSYPLTPLEGTSPHTYILSTQTLHEHNTNQYLTCTDSVDITVYLVKFMICSIMFCRCAIRIQQ